MVQNSEKFKAILKPLEEGGFSSDYMNHLNKMMEFERCFQDVESRYARIYAQVLDIEAKVAFNKTIM